MKKFALLLLLLLFATSLILACEGETNTPAETTSGITNAVTTLTETTESETTAPPALEAEDGTILTDTDLHGWFDYGTALYLRDDFKVASRDAISFGMMMNEIEGFQYILASTVDHSDLRCEVSPLTDGNGNTLDGTVYIAQNVNIRKPDEIHPRGFTPDALLEQDNPFHGGSFDVKAGQSKTLYVQYKTDGHTVPGIYTGTLEIKQSDTVLLTGEVSVKVYDLYYDEATECLTYIQYSHGPGTALPSGVPNLSNYDGLNEKFCDFLIANRLSPYQLPYTDELLNESAAKYMDNPRVNTVMLHYDDVNFHALADQYRVASENGWLGKISFSLFDEPVYEEHMNTIYRRLSCITPYFPTTRFMNAFGPDIPLDGRNVVERFSDFSTAHTINAIYLDTQPEIRQTLLSLKEDRGDTLYWYVCGSQKSNFINLLPCTPGTAKRILFWQQYQHDIDGFHYWHTTYWDFYADLWDENYENIKPKPVSSTDGPTGDGCLLYWDPFTYEPIGSLGLEAVRDGIEDFQLLRMAENVLGKETVMNYTKRLTTSATEYTDDNALLEQVKNELATALEVTSAQ